MGLISLLWGIAAMLWMVLALIPVIGIAFSSREKRGRAKAGLILNGLVIVVAVVRLSMFGGLL